MIALLAAAALSAIPATFNAPQDRAACIAQPELAWCAKTPQKGGSVATFADLAEVERLARFHFSFQEDGDTDVWQSYASRVNKRWKGDCDDLTFTVLDMLAQRGIDPATMRRVIVTPVGGDEGPHMIGIVTTDKGDVIVGETAQGAHGPLTTGFSKYRYVASSPVSGGTRWKREGN